MISKIKTNILNIFKKTSVLSLSLVLAISAVVLGLSNIGLSTNLNKDFLNSHFADAAAPNTSDLIIGKVDTGSAIEVSVCLKATDGPIHLTQVSNWFEFNTAALTPNPTILEKGVYGNNTNGYTLLGWEPVVSANPLPNNAARWTLRLNSNGIGTSPGVDGIAMQTTVPELYGKVKFDKIANSTASQNIDLVKNKYLSTEYPFADIAQNIVYVSSDCRNSLCPANTASVTGYNTSPNACVSTCSAGNFYQSSNSTCQPCPAGSYCNGGPTTTQCPANSYCPPSSPTPTPCPANTTSPAGSIAITSCISNCPAGKFLNTVTNTCDSCPSNTNSQAGSTGSSSCLSQCVDGSSLNTTTFNCDPCPAGYTCLGPTPPVQCPANSYCPPSSPTPTPCPANTTSPAGSTSLSQCVSSCTLGQYRNTTTNTCDSCPANMTANALATGIGACYSTCLAGTTLNTTNYTCQTCPAGSVCPPPVACTSTTSCPPIAPTPCPANTTSPAGSTSLSQCRSTCIAGKYLNSTTNTCDLCPSNQTSPAGASGVSSCSQLCVSGTYRNVQTFTCVPCPSGYVCVIIPCIITVSNPVCIDHVPAPCPANTTSPAGSTSLSQCTFVCTSGQYLNINNICTPCPANSYCPYPPAPCPANTVCPNPQPIPCPAGKSAPAGSTTIDACSIPSGEVIFITTASSSSSVSQISSVQPIAQNKVFKTKLHITDPYVCGEGSYGNVPDHTKYGVQAVYYDFYKLGVNFPSYSFKLKMNDNGDFYLPISPTTNVIKADNYRVVFYAFDSEGGKAQGEYSAYITDDCQNQNDYQGKGSKFDAIRTGGFSVFGLIILILIVSGSLYQYQKSKNKKLLEYDFSINIEK